MTLQEVLAEHRFTKGLPASGVAKLAALAREETFSPDQVVLVTGEQSRDFYLLLSGSVCVEVRAPHFTVSVQVLGPGDAFGWSSLLHHHDTLFQIRAREQTTAIRLDGSRLSDVCEENAEFGLALFRRLLDLVAGRVKATESRFGEFCGIASPAAGVSRSEGPNS
jgi:cAMP-binding proteins - catabolite gene activator and regulatory subunit of cAMP-dependent protein kinases